MKLNANLFYKVHATLLVYPRSMLPRAYFVHRDIRGFLPCASLVQVRAICAGEHAFANRSHR